MALFPETPQNDETLNGILERFATITGLPIKFSPQTSAWQNVKGYLPAIARYRLHRHPFCTRTKRRHLAACYADCAHGVPAGCHARRAPHLVMCHAGACEVRTGIWEGDQLLAILHLGPFETPGPGRSRAGVPQPKVREYLELAAALRDRLYGLLALARRDAPLPAEETARERILRFIEERLVADPGLAELAAHLHLSRNWASHYVRLHAGSSFQELKTAIRLEKATRLLRTTRLTVEAVGMEIGIADVHYFHRFYRQHTGQTPGEARAKNNGDRRNSRR